jgi:choline dehydrogenase-like flavoprotein
VARYDFIVIVIGTGSAGCAVAGRLASDSSSTVLLIEAGGTDRRFTIRAPLAFALQFGTSLDRAYESEPEPGCAGRRIKLPRGRALGGTSGTNAMIWVKGSNLDYDGWRVPGWAWTDVAPVFARMERRMHVARLQDPDELSSLFVTSARAAGVPANDDVSGPELDGAAISSVTIDRGQRWNTARGYLDHQKNLTVVTGAHVPRVVLQDGRATEPIASAVERELVPGPVRDIEAVIRETAITASHPGCTVAMGTDPDSPLDEKLRVRGLQGLRVADASALPVLPRANTNARSIMIGERCADFVLSDAR